MRTRARKTFTVPSAAMVALPAPVAPTASGLKRLVAGRAPTGSVNAVPPPAGQFIKPRKWTKPSVSLT